MRWDRASDLPARLRDLRVALGLLQEEFAERVGVVGQSISDYETGKSRPSKSRLERLARSVGIPVAAFEEGGPMPSSLLQRLAVPRSHDAVATSGATVSDVATATTNHANGQYASLTVDQVRERFDARMAEVRGDMALAEAVWWVGLALRATRSEPQE